METNSKLQPTRSSRDTPGQGLSCQVHGFKFNNTHPQTIGIRIPTGTSGYCECERKSSDNHSSRHRKYYTCDHETFSCGAVCSDYSPKATVNFDFLMGNLAQDFESLARMQTATDAAEVLVATIDLLDMTQSDIDGAVLESNLHHDQSDVLLSELALTHTVVIFVLFFATVCQLGWFSRTFAQQNVL
eukprot:c16680_g1_i2.p2 GENE.c16680_g1_i2~~c16680_g1_i2.p2  ORF type:complete len:187 (+),score=21.25 c16680_g1_i2:330-890(+)